MAVPVTPGLQDRVGRARLVLLVSLVRQGTTESMDQQGTQVRLDSPVQRVPQVPWLRLVPQVRRVRQMVQSYLLGKIATYGYLQISLKMMTHVGRIDDQPAEVGLRLLYH